MSYTVPFVITQFFTNGKINLQCGPTKIRYNIRRIKPYKLDTKVEDIIFLMISSYDRHLYTFVLNIKVWKQSI